jgi:hypothetical protein
MAIIIRYYKVPILTLLIFISSTGSIFSQELINKTDLFPNFSSPISYPALSPDGKVIVFLSDDELNKIAYLAVLSGKKWSDPKPLEVINNLFMTSSKLDAGGFYSLFSF